MESIPWPSVTAPSSVAGNMNRGTLLLTRASAAIIRIKFSGASSVGEIGRGEISRGDSNSDLFVSRRSKVIPLLLSPCLAFMLRAYPDLRLRMSPQQLRSLQKENLDQNDVLSGASQFTAQVHPAEGSD